KKRKSKRKRKKKEIKKMNTRGGVDLVHYEKDRGQQQNRDANEIRFKGDRGCRNYIDYGLKILFEKNDKDQFLYDHIVLTGARLTFLNILKSANVIQSKIKGAFSVVEIQNKLVNDNYKVKEEFKDQGFKESTSKQRYLTVLTVTIYRNHDEISKFANHPGLQQPLGDGQLNVIQDYTSYQQQQEKEREQRRNQPRNNNQQGNVVRQNKRNYNNNYSGGRNSYNNGQRNFENRQRGYNNENRGGYNNENRGGYNNEYRGGNRGGERQYESRGGDRQYENRGERRNNNRGGEGNREGGRQQRRN
ncbi:hypothetical protein IMG5_122860, partial [Ichthyophthirius multifiliis]